MVNATAASTGSSTDSFLSASSLSSRHPTRPHSSPGPALSSEPRHSPAPSLSPSPRQALPSLAPRAATGASWHPPSRSRERLRSFFSYVAAAKPLSRRSSPRSSPAESSHSSHDALAPSFGRNRAHPLLPSDTLERRISALVDADSTNTDVAVSCLNSGPDASTSRPSTGSNRSRRSVCPRFINSPQRSPRRCTAHYLRPSSENAAQATSVRRFPSDAAPTASTPCLPNNYRFLPSSQSAHSPPSPPMSSLALRVTHSESSFGPLGSTTVPAESPPPPGSAPASPRQSSQAVEKASTKAVLAPWVYEYVPPPTERHAMDKVVTSYKVPEGHVGHLLPQHETALAHFVLGLFKQQELRPFPTPADPIWPCAVIRPEALGNSATSLPGPPDGVFCPPPPPSPELEARGGPLSIATQQRIHLLRWLRARDWNVPLAMDMYRRAHAWKYTPPSAPEAAELEREVGAPPLDLENKLFSNWTWSDAPIVAQLGWRMYFHKTDKLGRPILIQDLAHIDTARIFAQVTPAAIVTHFAMALEAAMRYQYACASAQVPRTIEDNLMIINVQGLGLNTFLPHRSQLQQLLGLLDNNFPELSGRVQIINAPWVFATMFNYIKAWLPAATRDKIDIKGSGYESTLREWVEPANLPWFLGGECTCSDHGCEWDSSQTHRAAAAVACVAPNCGQSQSLPALLETPDSVSHEPLGRMGASSGSLLLSTAPTPGTRTNGTLTTQATTATQASGGAGTLAPTQFVKLSPPSVPGGLCTVANVGPWPRTYGGYLHLRFGPSLGPVA